MCIVNPLGSYPFPEITKWLPWPAEKKPKTIMFASAFSMNIVCIMLELDTNGLSHHFIINYQSSKGYSRCLEMCFLWLRCIYSGDEYVSEKRLGCYAACQEVSRCHARGQSEHTGDKTPRQGIHPGFQLQENVKNKKKLFKILNDN